MKYNRGMNVKGKAVIVTGASTGIGEAAAKLFSKKGAKVALVSRSKERLESLAKGLTDSYAVVCDMADEKQVKEMVKKVQGHYGGIDVLVNNAGRGYDASIEEIDREKFRYIFNLNLAGPLVAMQAVIPLMRKNGAGSIVNISSGTALMALPNMGAYSSLKRALVGLSLTAREELEKSGIVVSVVYPYITETNFEKNTLREGEEEEWDAGAPPFPADPPDLIAQKILEAVETGEAQVYAHDWMKNPR